MSRLRRLVYSCALGVLGLLLPASTYAGGGPAIGGGGVSGLTIMVDHMSPMGHMYSYQDYFPRMAYVHPGEVVTFVWAMSPHADPHTVSLLPRGVAVTDAALNSYFPGGASPVPDPHNRKLRVNRYSVAQPRGCGNSPYYPGTGPCNFNGTAPMNSGWMITFLGPEGPLRPAPQFVVRMTGPPGDYHWICLIHGGRMNGTIRVVAPGTAIPSIAAQAQAAARQYSSATANALNHEAQVAAHLPPPVSTGGHTTWTALAGDRYGRVGINEFFPRLESVKAGDAVTWLPGGFHTVSSLDLRRPPFIPLCDTGTRDVPFRGNLAGCFFEEAFSPEMFPFGKSGQPWTGGTMNSGNLVVPQVRSWTVTLPKSGTFQYHCLVHATMLGAIAVH